MVLEVKDLRYHLPGNGRPLVDGISFSVGAGETLVLLGRSGAGKTTTLKLVNRLLEPSSGDVRVSGTPAHAVEPTELRRRIGYVIQEIGLFPHFTVAANVGPPVTVTLAGANPAFKFFKVKDADSANVIFLETNNYTYNAALAVGTAPFGDKGFIVQRRGGDASILRKNNAQAGAAGPAIFQGTVGKKVNDADGALGAEAGGDKLNWP